MKYSKNTVKWMAAAAFAGVAFSAQATLIGSESFYATAASSDTYNVTDQAMTHADNFKVVVGNTGFGTNEAWVNASGAVTVNAWAGMVHSGVTGSTLVGNMHVKPMASGVDRNSRRNLAAVPALSSTYYLSGLVRLGAAANLYNGHELSVGFKQYINELEYKVDNGMHLGVRKVAGVAYLTASAGGNTWDLTSIAGKEAQVFQVVLQLDVSAGGADTFTAWYAEDGDTDLTLGLGATSVETWSDAGYLRRLVGQERSTAGAGPFGARFDEIRLGTELSDVTTIPEPATLGLIALSAGALYMSRRFRA